MRIQKSVVAVMAVALCLFAAGGAQAQVSINGYGPVDGAQLLNGNSTQLPYEGGGFSNIADVNNVATAVNGNALVAIDGLMINELNVIDSVILAPPSPGPFVLLQSTNGFNVQQAEGPGQLFGEVFGNFPDAPIMSQAHVTGVGDASSNIGYTVTDVLNSATFASAGGAIVYQNLYKPGDPSIPTPAVYSSVHQGVAQSNFATTEFGTASALDMDQSIGNTTNFVNAIAQTVGNPAVVETTNLTIDQQVSGGMQLTQEGYNGIAAVATVGAATITGALNSDGFVAAGQNVNNQANFAISSGALDLTQVYEAIGPAGPAPVLNFQNGFNGAYAQVDTNIPNTGADPSIVLVQTVSNSVNYAETTKLNATLTGTQNYTDNGNPLDNDTYGFNYMTASIGTGGGPGSYAIGNSYVAGIQDVAAAANTAVFLNGAVTDANGFTQNAFGNVYMNDNNTLTSPPTTWTMDDGVSNLVTVAAEGGNATSNTSQSVSASLNSIGSNGTLAGDFTQNITGALEQSFNNAVEVGTQFGDAAASGTQTATASANTLMAANLNGNFVQNPGGAVNQSVNSTVNVTSARGDARSDVNQVATSELNVITTNSLTGTFSQITGGAINQASTNLQTVSATLGNATIEGAQQTFNSVNVIRN